MISNAKQNTRKPYIITIKYIKYIKYIKLK